MLDVIENNNEETKVVKTRETIDKDGLTLTSEDGYSVSYCFNKDGYLVDEWETIDW